MQPYDYQEKVIHEVLSKFSTKNRVLLQAATGFGKTVCFSFIAKKFRRTLILCHRQELVEQTISTLNKIGLTAQAIKSTTKKVEPGIDVYVGMTKTVFNRLKKEVFSFDVDIIIADECHIREFEGVFEFFPLKKILGVTATPISNEKLSYWKCKTCKHEQKIETEECEHCSYPDLEEWRKPFVFSSTYEDIVVGPHISELIKVGQLVPDIPLAIPWGNKSKLKIDNKGDYTSKSMTESYGSEEAAIDVVKNYKEYAKGKRTLIFNPSTTANLKIFEQFQNEGIECRMYDLTNTPGVNRVELVSWFKNTEGAVLLSVGVFTTGFDAKSVECIILNRPTLSLSLYIQMVGRGGRSCNDIYKPNFLLIDGGGNIDRFGIWHEDKNDWRDIFFNGKGGPKKARINDLIDVTECTGCGKLISKSESVCSLCGAEQEKKQIVKEKLISNELAKPVVEIPFPEAGLIIDYTKRNKENIHFAFKLLQAQILDLFKYHRVTKELYLSTKNNGKLDTRIKQLITRVYFPLIKDPYFKNDTNRTLNYILNKTKEKIEKYYDNK